MLWLNNSAEFRLELTLCCFKIIDLAVNDVSVALVFFGRVLPTLSLGLTKSAFFSFFFLAEEPILSRWLPRMRARVGKHRDRCLKSSLSGRFRGLGT